MVASRQAEDANSSRRVVQGHVDDWEELAIDYLDGTLDAETMADVDAHLASCAACAARLGRQQAVLSVVHQIALEDSPRDLEDQVIGEILFPPTPRRDAVTRPEPSRWPGTWRRRFRPWIPVSVAVVAFFAIMISVGVLRSNGNMEMTTTSAALAAAATTAKAADTSVAMEGVAQASETTAAMDAALVAANGEATQESGAVGAGAVTTTASPAGSTTTVPPTYSTPNAATQDTKTMIAELQTASAPLYFVYQPLAPTGAGGVDASSAALADQLTTFTGLEPVRDELALGRTTFAAYVAKDDAVAFVELLQSIGSSLQLTLNLAPQPIALPATARIATYGATLRENKALVPELSAGRTPQPAVSGKYWFTTSTLPSDSTGTPPDWTAPDDAGTHVLVVIYLGE